MTSNLPFCPSCGASRSSILRDDCHDLLCGCPGVWALAECEGCGLVYTIPPIPNEELNNYYPPNYAPYNPAAGLRSSKAGGFLRKVAMLPYTLRFGSPDWAEKPFGMRRLLDVGCGGGVFLAQASRLGWSASGIDVSETAVAAARRNAPDASVKVAMLEDLAPGDSFDFINLSHVLEHLPAPRVALKTCFDHLAPGGQVRINVPNFGGWEARVFGRSWIGLDMPRHLVHFRKEVLEAILRQLGFEEISVRPAMFASSFSESFLLALPTGLRRRLLHSKTARLLYLSMVFPAAVSYCLGNAGAIDLTARKPLA